MTNLTTNTSWYSWMQKYLHQCLDKSTFIGVNPLLNISVFSNWNAFIVTFIAPFTWYIKYKPLPDKSERDVNFLRQFNGLESSFPIRNPHQKCKFPLVYLQKMYFYAKNHIWPWCIALFKSPFSTAYLISYYRFFLWLLFRPFLEKNACSFQRF